MDRNMRDWSWDWVWNRFDLPYCFIEIMSKDCRLLRGGVAFKNDGTICHDVDMVHAFWDKEKERFGVLAYTNTGNNRTWHPSNMHEIYYVRPTHWSIIRPPVLITDVNRPRIWQWLRYIFGS